MERSQWVNRINRALDVPLAVLSLVLLGLVLIDVFVEVSPGDRVWLLRANWAIWAVFVLEFCLKLVLAADRRRYVRAHWFDALVVVVPMFRVVRVLRILRVARAFPIFRMVAFLGVGLRGMERFVRRHRLGYLAVLSAIVTLGGAVAGYLLERHVPGTRFHNLGDALWWSAALMTTIASDLNPQTGPGRVLGVGLMAYAMVVVVYLISALSGDLFQARPQPTDLTVKQGLKELEGRGAPEDYRAEEAENA